MCVYPGVTPAPFLLLLGSTPSRCVSMTGYSAAIPKFIALFFNRKVAAMVSLGPALHLCSDGAGRKQLRDNNVSLLLSGDGAALCYYISNVRGSISDYKLISI